MSEHRIEFTISENPWAPTAVVDEINERTNSGLELVGLADQKGGVSSAAFVRWPDGRESALIRTKTPLERMRQTAEVVDLAKAADLPVPHHELVLPLTDGAVAVVQERLPGRHATRIDAGVVDTMVAMNERFAHLLTDRPDVPYPGGFLGSEQWEETLGQYSDRTRRVLARIREVSGGELHVMTGDDLIHTDYSLGNVLFDDRGQISGIVDWNFGADRGDRRFALLGMYGHLINEGDGYRGHRRALSRLNDVLNDLIGPELLRNYMIHRGAQGLHGSIRDFQHRPERIERDLRSVEALLD